MSAEGAPSMGKLNPYVSLCFFPTLFRHLLLSREYLVHLSKSKALSVGKKKRKKRKKEVRTGT